MKGNDIEKLYQKDKTEKPPVSLDNFILAQAKNSCDDKQSSPIKSNRNRWLYSLSSAAVVVLSFSVIFNLQHENTQISDQPMMLERLSIDDKNHKKENNSNFKKSANKATDDAVSESPLVKYEIVEPVTVPVEAYESADLQTPVASEAVASGAAISNSGLESKTNNGVINKPVAMSQPQAITPVIKKTKNEASYKDVSNKEEEEEEQTTVLQTPKITQSIEKEFQKSDYSTPIDDSETLDSITVTGSRLMGEQIYDVEETANSTKKLNEEMSFTQQIEQLDSLIKDKKLEQAKQMLKQLQKSYPYYDFSKYKIVFE